MPFSPAPAIRRRGSFGSRQAHALWASVGLVGLATALVCVTFVASIDAPLPNRMGAVLAVATAAAMHTRLALGRGRAAVQILLTAGALLQLGALPHVAVTVILSGLAASELIARSTGRSSVLSAGTWTAVVAGATATLSALGPASLPLVLRESGGAVIGAALGAPLLLVAGPVAEWLFGHTTRLTIAEWLSYDRPLLRDLASRAPGTFQHSINVGVLADAGARAIGGDALLARVGGLYHDVGKMRAPDYFVENQRDANPHDDLDPAESARILRAHVTDGADFVLDHKMGERIADFVREHHGTGTMRMFQQKAEALGWPEDQLETQFRYPGPRPQSRETAVLMIADQLEATARSSPPDTEAACATVVRETIRRIVAEDQLKESHLSGRDLARLEPALSRALLAMHHRRLTYPPSGAGSAPTRRLAVLPRLLVRRKGRA